MDRYTDASQDRALGLASWALIALLMLAPLTLARAAWAASDAGALEAPGDQHQQGDQRPEGEP